MINTTPIKGDIMSGKELGFNDYGHKYIWEYCTCCNVGHWISIGRIKYPYICLPCARRKTGRKHSEETKNRLSILRKQYYSQHPEEKENFAKRVHTKEANLKNALKRRGKCYMSEEMRLKLREKYTGENNPFYGKKHTETTKSKMRSPRDAKFRNKCSEVAKVRWRNYTQEQKDSLLKYIHSETANKLRGKILKQNGSVAMENNPRWKGGLSFEPYSPAFNNKIKKMIRERDNYTCQLCGLHENNAPIRHAIHHIDFNKKNSSFSNLITLCRKCHAYTFGNREYWINKLTNLVLSKGETYANSQTSSCTEAC